MSHHLDKLLREKPEPHFCEACDGRTTERRLVYRGRYPNRRIRYWICPACGAANRKGRPVK